MGLFDEFDGTATLPAPASPAATPAVSGNLFDSFLNSSQRIPLPAEQVNPTILAQARAGQPRDDSQRTEAIAHHWPLYIPFLGHGIEWWINRRVNAAQESLNAGTATPEEHQIVASHIAQTESRAKEGFGPQALRSVLGLEQFALEAYLSPIKGTGAAASVGGAITSRVPGATGRVLGWVGERAAQGAAIAATTRLPAVVAGSSEHALPGYNEQGDVVRQGTSEFSPRNLALAFGAETINAGLAGGITRPASGQISNFGQLARSSLIGYGEMRISDVATGLYHEAFGEKSSFGIAGKFWRSATQGTNEWGEALSLSAVELLGITALGRLHGYHNEVPNAFNEAVKSMVAKGYSEKQAVEYVARMQTIVGEAAARGATRQEVFDAINNMPAALEQLNKSRGRTAATVPPTPEVLAFGRTLVQSMPTGILPTERPTPKPQLDPQAEVARGWQPETPSGGQAPTGAAPTQPQGEPARPPGTVRFYHGGVPGEGARWVTPDRAYAEGYAAKSSKGIVQYVDIPENHPLLQKSFNDEGTSVKAPYTAFEAPADIAAGFKPLTQPPATPAPAKPPEVSSPQEAAKQLLAEATRRAKPVEQPEPTTPLPPDPLRTIATIVRDRFGKDNISKSAEGDYIGKVGDRKIGVVYNRKAGAAEIWVEGGKVGESLRKGSMEVAHHTADLAEDLAKAGLPIMIVAEPRRLSFYERVLTRQGFEKVSAAPSSEKGKIEQVWRKAAPAEPALSPREAVLGRLGNPPRPSDALPPAENKRPEGIDRGALRQQNLAHLQAKTGLSPDELMRTMPGLRPNTQTSHGLGTVGERQPAQTLPPQKPPEAPVVGAKTPAPTSEEMLATSRTRLKEAEKKLPLGVDKKSIQDAVERSGAMNAVEWDQHAKETGAYKNNPARTEYARLYAQHQGTKDLHADMVNESTHYADLPPELRAQVEEMIVKRHGENVGEAIGDKAMRRETARFIYADAEASKAETGESGAEAVRRWLQREANPKPRPQSTWKPTKQEKDLLAQYGVTESDPLLREFMNGVIEAATRKPKTEGAQERPPAAEPEKPAPAAAEVGPQAQPPVPGEAVPPGQGERGRDTGTAAAIGQPNAAGAAASAPVGPVTTAEHITKALAEIDIPVKKLRETRLMFEVKVSPKNIQEARSILEEFGTVYDGGPGVLRLSKGVLGKKEAGPPGGSHGPAMQPGQAQLLEHLRFKHGAGSMAEEFAGGEQSMMPAEPHGTGDKDAIDRLNDQLMENKKARIPPRPDQKPIDPKVLEEAKAKILGELAKLDTDKYSPPALGDLYDAVKKEMPALSLEDFKTVVAKMAASDDLQAVPYTRALATVPRPEAAYVDSSEVMAYARLPRDMMGRVKPLPGPAMLGLKGGGAGQNRTGAIDMAALGVKPEVVQAKLQEFWDQTEELAQHIYPRMTRADRSTGEAAARLISAVDYGKHASESFAEYIVGSAKKIPEKTAMLWGATYNEMRLRQAKEVAEQREIDAHKAGDAAESKKWGDLARGMGTMIGAETKDGHIPLPNEKAFLDTVNSKEFHDMFVRWLGKMVPKMEENYHRAQGLPDNEDIHSWSQIPGAPINMMAVDPNNPTSTAGFVGGGKGNLRAPKQKKFVFAEGFTGASEAYEMDLRKIIENTFAKGEYAAAQADFYRTAVDKGVAAWGPPGRSPGEGFTHELPDVRPPKGTQTNEKGQASLWFKSEGTLDEARRALAPDKPMKALPLAKALTVGTLSTGVEAVSHTANILRAVSTEGWNPVAFYKNFKGLIASDPVIKKKLLELFRVGAAKSKGFESGSLWGRVEALPAWVRKTDPTMWAGKALDFFSNVQRLTLADAYDSLAAKGKYEAGNETEKRNFINTALGQYNIKAQHWLVAKLRESMVGPFATAVTTATGKGIRDVAFYQPGAKATSATASVQIRMERFARVAAVYALANTINYLATGNALGSDDTPIGAIYTGRDDKGNPTYFNLAGLLTSTPRGMKETGISSLIEGLRQGQRPGYIRDSILRDLVHTVLRPAEGPIFQFAEIAATGRNPVGRLVSADEHSTGSNIVAAFTQANPTVAAFAGHEAPGHERTTGQAFIGMAGPFNPTTIGRNAALSNYQDRFISLQHQRTAAHESGRQFANEREYQILLAFHQPMVELEHAIRGQAQTRQGLYAAANQPAAADVRRWRQTQVDLARRALEAIRK